MPRVESTAPKPTRQTAVVVLIALLCFALIAFPIANGLRMVGFLFLLVVMGYTVSQSPPARRLGDIAMFLIAFWAVVFLAGAAGELLDIGWLRDATDLKKIFLR